MFYNDPNCSYKLLGVFYVEREKWDAVEANRIHTAISYRISGCSTFHMQNQSLYAGSGAIVYIPAGYDYRHVTPHAEKIIVLHLDGAAHIGNELQLESDASDLEPLFRNLLETWEEGSPSSYNRCMALLYRLFAALQEKHEKKLSPVPASIAPGVELLRKSFRDSRLTVARLAQACFVSEVYFRRIYRAYAGQSPLQTILDLRFQHARTLLASGYYTPTQAAALSGFSDVKYFRTAFKKRYGLTVSEFAAKKP